MWKHAAAKIDFVSSITLPIPQLPRVKKQKNLRLSKKSGLPINDKCQTYHKRDMIKILSQALVPFNSSSKYPLHPNSSQTQ